MMTTEEKQEEVICRTQVVMGWIRDGGLPPDHMTTTALAFAAALIMKASGKCTREEFLATCASCFDSAPGPAELGL